MRGVCVPFVHEASCDANMVGGSPCQSCWDPTSFSSSLEIVLFRNLKIQRLGVLSRTVPGRPGRWVLPCQDSEAFCGQRAHVFWFWWSDKPLFKAMACPQGVGYSSRNQSHHGVGVRLGARLSRHPTVPEPAPCPAEGGQPPETETLEAEARPPEHGLLGLSYILPGTNWRATSTHGSGCPGWPPLPQGGRAASVHLHTQVSSLQYFCFPFSQTFCLFPVSKCM